MKSILRRTLPLLLAGSQFAYTQDGSTRIIVTSGTPAPNLNANFTTFATPVLNGGGNVAFTATAGSSASAVYKTNGSSLVTIVKNGDAAPVIGAAFTSFASPLLNESGTVAFFGYNSVFQSGLQKVGIYTGVGDAPRTLTTMAAYGQSAAGLGVVTEFGGQASLSDSGSVAVHAIVNDSNSGTSDPDGLFISNGSLGGLPGATAVAMTTQPVSGVTFTDLGSVVQNNLGVATFTGISGASTTGVYTKLAGSNLNTIATTSQAVPVIGGTFKNFASTALNDRGEVLFTATSTVIGSLGVFIGSGGVPTAIATTATPAPGLGGNFISFSESLLSNSGLVCFAGTGAAPSYSSGIFIGSGSTLQTVATTLQNAPMIGGNFTEFTKLAMNDIGTVAFLGLNGTAGKQGLYLGDGQELITVAFTGQSLAGSTIKNDGISFNGGADRGGSIQVNNNGQITYKALLNAEDAPGKNKQVVLLFTPTLHFRNTAGGSWATRNNWTIGILPSSVHDVVLDPVSALSVAGPMLPTTVKSLAVGSAAGGVADLTLQNAGTITATDGLSTLATGRIRGTGKLVGNLTNAGTLAPGLPASSGLITILGNVTLQASSHLALDLGGLVRKTNYDYLSISGTLSLGGSLDVTLLGGFVPQAGQSFDLFDASGTSGTFSLLNLPTLASGLAWNTSQLSSAGVIAVNATGPVVSTWTQNGNGSWSTSLAGNWSSGVPNGNGASATFGPASTSPATVSVDGGPLTVGTITFNNTSGYTVAGPNAITLADSAATPGISVTLGSHTVSAPLILSQNASVSTAPGTTLTISGTVTGGASSLAKTGAGILNLDGTQTYAALNASAGTTNVDAAIGTGASAVSVTGAGTLLKFGSVSQNLASLTIGAGATVTFTSGAASFGAGSGKAQTLGSSAVVPEPGSLGLLLTGTLGLLSRRRRPAPRL